MQCAARDGDAHPSSVQDEPDILDINYKCTSALTD